MTITRTKKASAKKIVTNASIVRGMTADEQQIAYAQMWDDLGLENSVERKPNWGIDENKSIWEAQKVFTDKGFISADKAMRLYGYGTDGQPLKGRLTDSSPGFGGGFATGTVNINQINNLAIDNVFLGWGELELLQQNNLVNTICTIFGDNMTQKWIEIYSEDDGKKEKVSELKKATEKFELQSKINIAAKKMMRLGTMYVSPKLKGDEDDLAEPLLLSPAKIKKGDLEDIYVIEPTWTIPVEYNMVNPRMPNFYKPQQYIVFGKTIHATRMQRMIYIEPDNLIAPLYLFGGIPFIQTILPYILDFLNTKREIVRIVSRFNISILKTDLNALHGSNAYGKNTTLAGTGKGRARAFNGLRNNFGIFMISEKEDFVQMQINVSGLTDILQQQAELLSLFTRIPVAKLFGQAPKGLNATGEYDADAFNDLIASDQESKLRKIITYCLELIQLNEFGEIDPDIKFRFVPIGSLNKSTQSALKTEKVKRFTDLAAAGMADPQKLMEIAVADPELELTNYNVTGDEDLNESEDDISEDGGIKPKASNPKAKKTKTKKAKVKNGKK